MAMSGLLPTPRTRRCGGAHAGDGLIQGGLILFDGDEVAMALFNNLGHRFFWQCSASKVNSDRSIRKVPINCKLTSA
jgi:hypothetical protein